MPESSGFGKVIENINSFTNHPLQERKTKNCAAQR